MDLDRPPGNHSPAEWDASSYHRLSNPQFSWGRQILELLPLSGDETAIDAGCGTGRLTAELLERLPEGRVIAVDRSLAMLQAARDNLSPRFSEQIAFVRADVQALPLQACADLILSTATFHWAIDHPALFRSLFQALKPGGLLMAQCGGEGNLASLLMRAGSLMASEPFRGFFTGWRGPWEYAGDETTAERLQEAGFMEVETGLIAAPTILASAREYQEFLTGIIFRAHLARLPEPHLRSRFIDTLTEQATADDPPFRLDYQRLNLRTRRPGEARR